MSATPDYAAIQSPRKLVVRFATVAFLGIIAIMALSGAGLYYFWLKKMARRGNLWVDWRQVKGFCLVAGSGIASCK